jgi:CRISPR system Cascade subunit CasE
MYFSQLLIHIGEDPDKPRPGRLWLRNTYRVHQRLCMAFPSDAQKRRDPAFVKPYNPEGFEAPPVGVPRNARAGFLYSIMPNPGGNTIILVQSFIKPDWDYAFHNARYLLSAPPQIKERKVNYGTGEKLRFRLTANPTKKIDTKTGLDGKKNNGRRVPVHDDALEDWLVSRADKSGFRVQQIHSVRTGYVYFDKRSLHARNGNGNCETSRLRAATYEGLLEVTNEEAFRNAVVSGIGPEKAFGFGLLCLART